MSSRYSLAPSNVKQVREGRSQRARVDEDVRRLSHSGRVREDSKQSLSNSSLVNVERQVTIASAEMYPESGISLSSRWTRLVADKSSLGNPGNGMYFRLSFRSRGADAPKNESGMTDDAIISVCKILRSVSIGNGFCISDRAFSHSGLEILQISM